VRLRTVRQPGKAKGVEAHVADGGQSETSPAAEVVAAAMAAYERGDLEALARLIDADAEVQMLLLGGDSARGPDSLRELLGHEAEIVHHPTLMYIEPVADDAAIMIGRIQYADAGGGLTDREAAWLSVTRGGKIRRTRVFGSPKQARAAYAELHGAETADGK
jgi:ketosteroid isomerase-like protein